MPSASGTRLPLKGTGAPPIILGAMPANLPPQYKEAEQRYREARSHDEKLEALREMMALLPRHKGTDKLQADLRHRISKK
jgi:hypothetical protein